MYRLSRVSILSDMNTLGSLNRSIIS